MRKQQTFVYSLIIINIIVYLYEVMLSHSLIAINGSTLLHVGAVYTPLVMQGQKWRLLTAMFIHLSIGHIFSNMLSLVVFAQEIGNLYSLWQLGLIYIISGLAGNIASVYLLPTTVSAGASGAIMGLLGAMLGLIFNCVINNKMNLVQYCIGLVLLNTVFAASGTNIIAHGAGFIAGFAIGSLFTIINNSKRSYF